MSFISNFFLNCSGINKQILSQVPSSYVETERNKFIGIGGTIFFTACLAFVSASFALSTFVKDLTIGPITINKFVICISIGFVWGMMIFNLDQYIVSSMRKRGKLKQELIHAIPRIIIALLFAAVISKPLELEIFRSEIEAQLPQSADNQTRYLKEKMDSISNQIFIMIAKNDTLRTNPYDSDFVRSATKGLINASNNLDSIKSNSTPLIANIRTTIDSLKNVNFNIAEKRRILYFERDNLRKEIANDSLSFFNDARKIEIKKINNVRYNLKKKIDFINERIEKEEKEILKINRLIAVQDSVVLNKADLVAVEKENIGSLVKKMIFQNENSISELKKKLQTIEEERHELNNLFTGLLARLKALDDLKSKKGNLVIYIASTLIFLIFLAIESAPIFVKLLSHKTPYDQILEEYEKPLPKIELVRLKINRFYDEDVKQIEKEKELLRKFYEQKLKIQKRFLNKSLIHLKAKESSRFENNKDRYSTYITENPKKYISSFKSENTSMTVLNGKVAWDNDKELRNLSFKEKYLKGILWA